MKGRLLAIAVCLLALPLRLLAETEILVLAAASLTDALDEIIEDYKAIAPEVRVTASYDASGKLLAQLKQGAPADVFIAAASKQMDAAQEEGLLLEGTRIELLENKAVLIVPAGEKSVTAFEEIENAAVIAIGDPDVVPAGGYARKILENAGIWDRLNAQEGRIARAGNVREVLAYVATGNADAGIVYATDAAMEPDVNVAAEATEEMCGRILYPAGVISGTRAEEQARAFLSYVAGEAGGRVLERYGFTPCKPEGTP